MIKAQIKMQDGNRGAGFPNILDFLQPVITVPWSLRLVGHFFSPALNIRPYLLLSIYNNHYTVPVCSFDRKMSYGYVLLLISLHHAA